MVNKTVIPYTSTITIKQRLKVISSPLFKLFFCEFSIKLLIRLLDFRDCIAYIRKILFNVRNRKFNSIHALHKATTDKYIGTLAFQRKTTTRHFVYEARLFSEFYAAKLSISLLQSASPHHRNESKHSSVVLKINNHDSGMDRDTTTKCTEESFLHM